MQLSPGDLLEFSICLFNLNGLINLHSLQWEAPEFLPIPSNERNSLVYNKDIKALMYKERFQEKRKGKVYANTNRICEVEDSVVEWIPLSKNQSPKLSIEYR